MSEDQQITYDVSKLTAVDFFGYYPSLALAATSLGVFLLAAIILAFQIYRYGTKQLRYMHLVTVTGLTEAAGYISLIYLIQKSGATNIYGAYVAFQVFVVLSPNLLQAADYSTVGKIIDITNLSSHYRWLKPRYISVGFVLVDVAALVIQAIGISIWATSKGNFKAYIQRYQPIIGYFRTVS